MSDAPTPTFYIGQRVRFKDSAFKENTGTICAYFEGEIFPYAVRVRHRDQTGADVVEEYGFRGSELVDASGGQLPLWDGA